MGDYYYSKDAGRFAASGVGTTAGTTQTIAAVTSPANAKLHCTGIQCSGDAAALVTIESPSGTVLWRKRFAAAFSVSEAFPLGSVVGASGQAILVKISASTANCEANIQALAIFG